MARMGGMTLPKGRAAFFFLAKICFLDKAASPASRGKSRKSQLQPASRTILKQLDSDIIELTGIWEAGKPVASDGQGRPMAARE